MAVLAVSACNATANADGDPPGRPRQAASRRAPPPRAHVADPDGRARRARRPRLPTTRPTSPSTPSSRPRPRRARSRRPPCPTAARGATPSRSTAPSKGGTWTAGDLLEPGVKYTLALEAKGADGTTTEETRTFRTANLSLDDQVYVSVSPRDGGKVGVGMPVVVRFDLPVVDKASFEEKMTVTTTPHPGGLVVLAVVEGGALAPEDVLEGRHQGQGRRRPQRRARRRRPLGRDEPHLRVHHRPVGHRQGRPQEPTR